MKCAVLSCMGLGDGLLALILSNNLSRAGHEVDTYHPFLGQLQSWVPHLPILPFPSELPSYDHYFLIYEKSPWMLGFLEKCLRDFRSKTTVLNPIATPNCDYPYWEEGRFDGKKPFADNLVAFCRDILQLPDPTKDNGFKAPFPGPKDPKRIIIHPTSSRAGKNWSKSQYLRLAEKLRAEGLEPAFIVPDKEREAWQEVSPPQFETLSDMASFVAGGSFMIGNDSGIGHLASCLGIESLIICRSRLVADFWRPAWKKGLVVYPPKWIPNLKGMRWRDRHWQKFIPVSRIYKLFQAQKSS